MRYTAKSLEDVAKFFDSRAQEYADMRLKAPTFAGQTACSLQENAWREAAKILRATTIEPEKGQSA